MTEPDFPPDLVPGPRIGEGRRSVVYRAVYRGETVAAKIYRPEFIEKYRERYRVNIAEFELGRNRAVRDLQGLRPFVARPVGIVGLDGGRGLAFLQEFIDGIPLVELGLREHGLPRSVLDAGQLIVSRAERAGLHDLDLYYRNVLVRECKGEWLPVLHDFNLMPQHLFPPNPFLWLAYRSGIRRKSHRDRRCIRQWHAFSEDCRTGKRTPA